MSDVATVLVPALGRVLLDFLWQGILIGVFAALALHALRGARPQARYLASCLALLACVLVPAISLIVRIAGASAPVASLPASLPVTVPLSPLTVEATAVSGGPQFDVVMPWIVMLWASGAGALSLRMGMGLLWIARLRATPQTPVQATWQARLDALASRFGLDRAIALRLVDGLDSPVSAGWWKPVVLLPAGLLTRMPVELVEALLAHELAHVRRHDYLVNLMQSVAEALLFYHPVTWWLSRRIRIEREHVADRLAADVTGEPRRLALALSTLSELNAARGTHAASLHLAQAAHGGHLMSRIEQLVRPGHRSARGALALPLVGVAAACLAFYAHAQIGTTQQPAPRAVAQAAAPQAGTKVSPRPVTKPATLRKQDDHVTYALITQGRDGITMSGSTDDLPEIRQAQRSIVNTDFVWTRVDGKAYVISDAGTIARINDAWRDTRKLDDRMEALDKQMEVHSDRMEALERQMEQLTPPDASTDAIEAASRRMEELGEQQGLLAARQAQIAAGMARADASEQRQLSAKMDALSQEQDALSRQMDQHSRVLEEHAKKLDANAVPMEALSRQMEEASKPMQELGRQMEALGREQEKITEQAERTTRKAIDDAIARGLAQPAPGSSAQ